MNLLNKLTLKNLKLNKKRTVVTILGIMLSVALIMAVATMYSSLIKSLINFETYEKGNFHVLYNDVPIEEVEKIKNTRGVENVLLTQDIGYAYLDNSKNEYKPYIFVKGFTRDSLQELSIKLVDGRLPENNSEIIIPTHLKTNGRVTLNIGDTITLDIGKRISYDGYELKQNNPYQKYDEEELKEKIIEITSKTYKIVGIIERPASNIECYSAPGYTFITLMDESLMTNKVDVFTKYTRTGSKEYTKVTASILGVDEDSFTKAYTLDSIPEDQFDKINSELKKAKYKYDLNKYLIMLEIDPLNENSAGSIGRVVAIVIIIIMVTSIFCIKNSFDISITEKIKQYGMLRSVGATKKQIKKNVFYEGTILGLIGIPLGLLLGLFASHILIIICNFLLKDMVANGLKLVLSYSWVALLISLALGFITIYASTFRSARRASTTSPINSIRNSANIKIKPNKLKCPRIIKSIFGIGGEISYKNLKRNKRKYRTTIISIIVSVATFIPLSYFISSAFNMLNLELSTYDYNVSVTKYQANEEYYDKAIDLIKSDGIKDYSVYRSIPANLKNPKYNEVYLSFSGFDDDFTKQDSLIHIVSLGDYQYRKYLKELHLDYNDLSSKGILIDTKKVWRQNEEGKDESAILREFSYQKGDSISVNITEESKTYSFEIAYITDKYPFGKKDTQAILIVNDRVFNAIKIDNKYEMSIYFDSNNPDKLQDEIDALLNDNYSNLQNIDEEARVQNNLYILIAIFLYGFIIVISLIGITNIFNTITSNMHLRRQEFAMLKSIGMTKKEFSKLIKLESLFIGINALVFGIPIGTLVSYIIYYALNMDLNGNIKFTPPFLAIIVSIIVVYLLIEVLMNYSMNKINKQNTIETIRNENI